MKSKHMKVVHQTKLGVLFQADCLDFLRTIHSESVHTFFADPPFNLGKLPRPQRE